MPPATPTLREQFLLPPAELRPLVRHLLLLTTVPEATPAVRTLLPNFQVLLLINLGPAGEIWFAPEARELVVPQPLHGMQLVGPLKQPMQYRLPGGARVLVVTFTLDGFYRLFQLPADSLTPAAFTDPDTLMAAGNFVRLLEQLRHQPQPAQLVATLAAFCRSYLHPPDAAQAELLGLLPLLSAQPHLNPLRVMAAASRLSERTWQLRFRKYLGFSAKEAGRFLRFRQVVEHLRQPAAAAGTPPPPDWFALLNQYGYHDQSHLIHDFTHFLHQSPTQVRAQLLDGDTICFTKTELLAPE